MVRRRPAGEFRHVIDIVTHPLDAGTTFDTYGQVTTATTAWSKTLANRRAKIEQLSGDELALARQLYPNASYRITMDYESALNSTGATRKAVIFANRFLYIGAIQNTDMENIEHVLLCGESR